MRLNGNEDLRVRRTIGSIRKAFEELLYEKDYEQISVRELTERAMIKKKSFYSYYDSLDDLLQQVQDELAEEYVERVRGYSFSDIEHLTREFFLFSEEKGPFYEKITCSDTIIRTRMIRNVAKSAGLGLERLHRYSEAERKLIGVFINSTTLSIYRQWIADGKKVPVENVIRLTSDLIKQGISSIETE